MSTNTPFHTLRQKLNPNRQTRMRIKERIDTSMVAPVVLEQTRHAVTATKSQKTSMWQRTKNVLQPQSALQSFGGLQSLLQLTDDRRQQMKMRIFESLPHHPVTGTLFGGFMKWIAAFAILALVVRVSPFFFLAPPTEAFTAVYLLPQGEVAILEGGTWAQETQKAELSDGMHIRTQEGSATILYHEHGVIRLDDNTSIVLHDTSNSLQPAREQLPTLTLLEGRIWYLGFIPVHLRGFTMDTQYGQVTVHEGSVSVSKFDAPLVEVLDRRATVRRGSDEVHLINGEGMVLQEKSALQTNSFTQERYHQHWYKQNLEKDAVHRSEIAQAQQERLAAQAGILPTSSLYPVKRIAEKVEEFFTIGEQARLEQKLQQAETRLSEAAALLAQGKQEASVHVALEEYQKQLQRLSSEGDTILAQFLVQESLDDSTADIAAALPGDTGYLLKKAVLEANALVADHTVSTEEIHNAFLIDTVEALRLAVEQGAEEEGITTTWNSLQEHLVALEDESSPFTREIQQELTKFASAVDTEQKKGNPINPTLVEALTPYLPAPEVAAASGLTDQQVQAIISGVSDRILLNLTQEQSRQNQLHQELHKLEQSHAPAARLLILRKLQTILPGSLKQEVRASLRTTRLEATNE